MARYPLQPSVTTVAPGMTSSLTNPHSDAADASGIGAMRHRPNPSSPCTSTAIATSVRLLGVRPGESGVSPPKYVSSTSTRPVSLSRPGRTNTDRNRCSIAHAVWYDPISNCRCRLEADTPSLLVANNQQALNHTLSGVRERSNSVPAVTDVREPQPEHMKRPSASRQPAEPHAPHTKPFGHRNHSR